MRFSFCFIVSALALLSLGACGFTPLYGTVGQAERRAAYSEFAHVSISTIPDREGQYLRNALIDRLHRSGAAHDVRYALKLSPLQESFVNLDLTRDANTTRGQLRMRTTMELYDVARDEIAMIRALSAITSYNILDSEFSARVSEENTRLNALNDLAAQVEQQLALYFRSDHKEAFKPAPDDACAEDTEARDASIRRGTQGRTNRRNRTDGTRGANDDGACD